MNYVSGINETSKVLNFSPNTLMKSQRLNFIHKVFIPMLEILTLTQTQLCSKRETSQHIYIEH